VPLQKQDYAISTPHNENNLALVAAASVSAVTTTTNAMDTTRAVALVQVGQGQQKPAKNQSVILND
jgi:hypothetical protein